MSDAKRAAGRRAAEFVEDGMTLGLGTGSTVLPFLEALAERVNEGLVVRGVPTSVDTQRVAQRLGLPLLGLDEVERLDLTVDGADEIDGAYDMIKGGGGALLREKVIASISERVLIVVDASKLVQRLGTTFALPVEVAPFALSTVRRALERLGAAPVERRSDESAYRTDNGNAILDARFPEGIEAAAELEDALLHVPGVVEVGLFIGLAHGRVVGTAAGSAEVAWKA
jgi:ribose 5-phosphate isomerase A